jgi:hypothetical protein
MVLKTADTLDINMDTIITSANMVMDTILVISGIKKKEKFTNYKSSFLFFFTP